jgi:hypothetical protein
MSNGAISNARNAVIKLTGTITGNQVVTVPTGIEKTYIISNGTTGAFTVQFIQAGGTGVTFATTDKSTRILFADGTNIVDTGTVSTSGVQTLTNKTLTSPIINEIDDANSNEQVIFTSTASAVNEFTITNAATGNAPEISATGSDTNIDLKITPKGSGKINLDGIKFPNADGSSGQFLKTDGSGSLSFADSGLAWQSVVTTSTITVVAGRAYFINTTSNACTVTLPSGTPTAGQQIQLVDYAGTFDTNALTINPNGNKIEGGTGSLQLTGDREGVILTYIDATQGWLATSGINEGTDALTPAPYSIDFLVIAGGGGGGSENAGGGGAGGYRTSTQTVNGGIAITVTVGDGGAGAATNASEGTNGSNSSISGTGLSTITSNGGGGGGSDPRAGLNGGSGGGGGATGNAPSGGAGGSGNTPNTSPSQGNNGGSGSTRGSPGQESGGGGGGANAGGGNGANTVAGAGGAGTASSITGSSITRAGGGGGGSNGGTLGAGGNGGGGAGTNSDTVGGAATVNTGGGGGGSGGNNGATAGGAGGKGVVILSMPDANYSGTTTGSPTVATGVSGKTVLTFTGTGSYTT